MQRDGDDCNVSELAESDAEVNGADREDNLTLDSLSERSASLCGDKGHESDEEFNLNISFCGGYVPNTDLKRVDKGKTIDSLNFIYRVRKSLIQGIRD
jgi:hypothetical protein